jgi:ATP-dependent RNA helicase DHX57
VDHWIVFSAVGRVVALINALRRKLDALLDAKISNPGLQISKSDVVKTTVRIIATDGLG